MAIYRLQRFPSVCMHCLKPVDLQTNFTSINSYHDELHCTIEQKSAELFGVPGSNDMREIPAAVRNMLPNQICQECLLAMVAFHQYQSKLRCLMKFSVGLAHLLHSNADPLVELFGIHGRYLVQVLKSFNICRGKEEYITLEMLLQEVTGFDQYKNRDSEDSATSGEGRQSQSPYNSNDLFISEEYCEPRRPCVSQKMQKAGPNRNTEIERERKQLSNLKSDKAVVTDLKKRKSDKSVKNNATTTFIEGTSLCKCKYDFCDKIFTDLLSMKKHIRKDHKTFVCNICGSVRQFYSHYKHHMARHNTSTIFICEYCNAEYSTKQELINHLKVVHIVNPDEECTCNVCGVVCRGKYHFNRHMKSHNIERKFVCPVCSKAFKTSHHLRRHADVHQKLQYRCAMCDTSYGRRDKMRAHLEIVHNIQSYFVCVVCLATFDEDGLLQQHMERHRNPKMLECCTCLGVFLSEADLKDHCCITYQDSYLCCGRDFRYHSYYNKHMMVEHGIKCNVRVKPPKDKLLSQYRALRPAAKVRNC
ncbi:zinc finger and BTB domain-containing protein 41-like [Anopheles ziemanni]|uniref:zinc finger and BTB domain-containing protein 41-like n=1 Tax=Anopheles ziemanni TaxID=345580 RepID=UPI0026604F17|nr:zinc finger and BTB domain-containing protein 41-like [Anopheles ziemanni]